MKNSTWRLQKEIENRLFCSARLEQKRYCIKNNVFIYINGLYETPKRMDSIAINDGTWLKFQTKCKGGQQIHIKNLKTDYRKVIRSYACFLRAVGVDDINAMLFYILDFTTYYISFYRGGNFYNYKTNSWEHQDGLKINFDKTIKLIYEVMKWVLNKDVKDIDVSAFVDKRKRKAPEIFNATNGNMSKSIKMKIVKQDENKEIYERISKMYNPELSNEENCKIICCSEPTLIKWKKANTETKEERINRLYNKNLSWKENEDIIGYSRNTIKKYLKEEVVEMESNINMNIKPKIEKKMEIANEPIKIKEVERDVELDLDDDWCRKMFGDDFMAELEREKARNERVYSKFEGFDF